MRRGSIARLMTAIGLSSLVLVYLRVWLGPDNWFGFLGLLSLLLVVSWIAWIATFGRLRRFFLGFGAVGLVVWVGVLVAPDLILDFCRDRVIIPIHRWLHTNPMDGDLEFEFLWAELGGDFTYRADPSPVLGFGDRAEIYRGYLDLQGRLLIPVAVPAIVGGLIAAWFRPGRTPPPSPDLRP